MAVRHGYGKIAGTDALVFAYDTGDTRNSFKGEPTVNLAANIQTLEAWGGATSIREDAPEKGPGWKKVTFTEINGTNYRIAKFPYLTHPVSTTRTYSVEYDVGNLTGYSLKVDGSGGYSEIPISGRGRHSATVTTGGTYSEALFFLKSGTHTGINEVVYYKEYQVEEKSHATPFVNGTRSATQGLLDLTGNNTVNVNNLSFNSNAHPTWDGTNDSLGIGTIVGAEALSQITLETVVKSTANNKNITYSGGNGIILHYGGAGFYLVSSDNVASGYLGWNNELAGGAGAYEHLTATWDGTTMKLYVNGQQTASDRAFSGGGTGVLKALTSVYLGLYFNSSQPYYQGDIDIFKIYNRALTADEIRTNYVHYKGRYQI